MTGILSELIWWEDEAIEGLISWFMDEKHKKQASFKA